MSFPAYHLFERDIRVTPRTMRAYAWFRDTLNAPHPRAFTEPQRVKLVEIANGAMMSEANASRSLRWLIGNGYIKRHNTEQGMAYSLAYEVPPELAKLATCQSPKNQSAA